ncbi:DUF3993 domain-containing protein [Cytobacillus massiliigabonensis]|uniref:DUF3993 domain-containing protein n=1 Tax=Cytobacillus massiliigabonensis TaxID=1871011 RepID=UPI000C8615B2|nr:DUF3993 domain-containing protein [Cytobacillus massiliigabonensis]
MKKKHLIFLSCILLLSFIFPSLSRADSDFLDDKSVFQFLQEAFRAQVSLGEKLQSMEEIHEALFPYFTEGSMDQFLDENLFTENGKYITYGTDFPIYYIPFFTYTSETKVVRSQDHIFIFEFFPEADEGPVSYESHYEGVRLDKVEGDWKVAEFLYDNIPSEIIEEAEGAATPIKMELAQKSMVKVSLQIGLVLNPIASFYKYGSSCVVDHLK